MKKIILASLLAAAALLNGCGKNSSSNNSAAKPPAPAAAPASLAAATPPASVAANVAPPAPAAPLPPAQTVADRLLAGGFVPAHDGYTVQQKLACTPAGKGDDWTVDCRAWFNDPARGGQPAIVEIQLFDHDVNFAVLDKPLKDHIDSLKGNWTMGTSPDIAWSLHGVTTALQAACYQALGHPNSPAYCDVLVNPRVYVIAGVKPAHANTDHVTVSTADDSPTLADVNHARDLVTQMVAMVHDGF